MGFVMNKHEENDSVNGMSKDDLKNQDDAKKKLKDKADKVERTTSTIAEIASAIIEAITD